MSKYNKVMENIVVTKDMRDRVLKNIEKELENGPDASEKSTDKKTLEKTINLVSITRYAKIAAALAILIVGAYAVNKVVPMGEKTASTSYDAAPTESPQMAAEETYESATETESYEPAAEEADMMMETEEASVETAGTMTNGESSQSVNYESANTLSGNIKKSYPSFSMLSRAAGVKFKAIAYLDSFASSKEYYLYDKKIALIFYDMAGNEVIVKEMLSTEGKEIPASVSGCSESMNSEKSFSVGDIEVSIFGTNDTYRVAKWTEGNLVFELESTDELNYEAMYELMGEIASQ